MRASQIAGIGIGLVILGLSVSVAVLCNGRTRARSLEGNDLQILFDQYTTELASYRRSGATDLELRGVYAQWLDRFADATSGMAASEIPDAVRFAQLALAHGAWDFESAEQIALEGALHAKRASDRLSFLQQRLILRNYLSTQVGDVAGVDVQVVANEACDAARLVASEPGFAEDAFRVLDFVSTFDAACQGAGGDQDRTSALCAEAADVTRSVSQDVWERIGWGWAPEQWLERAAESAVKAGDVEGALMHLQNIDRLPVLRRSAGAHALIVTGEASRGHAFHADVARAWLRAAGERGSPEDLRIAYALGFWLTQCSIRPGDTMEGISVLESVLASPDSVPNDADSEAFIEMRPSLVGQPHRWQLEPVRSGALTALALTYYRIGLRGEAREAAQQVLAGYPGHPSTQAIQVILSQP